MKDTRMRPIIIKTNEVDNHHNIHSQIQYLDGGREMLGKLKVKINNIQKT